MAKKKKKKKEKKLKPYQREQLKRKGEKTR